MPATRKATIPGWAEEVIKTAGVTRADMQEIIVSLVESTVKTPEEEGANRETALARALADMVNAHRERTGRSVVNVRTGAMLTVARLLDSIPGLPWAILAPDGTELSSFPSRRVAESFADLSLEGKFPWDKKLKDWSKKDIADLRKALAETPGALAMAKAAELAKRGLA